MGVRHGRTAWTYGIAAPLLPTPVHHLPPTYPPTAFLPPSARMAVCTLFDMSGHAGTTPGFVGGVGVSKLQFRFSEHTYT